MKKLEINFLLKVLLNKMCPLINFSLKSRLKSCTKRLYSAKVARSKFLLLHKRKIFVACNRNSNNLFSLNKAVYYSIILLSFLTSGVASEFVIPAPNYVKFRILRKIYTATLRRICLHMASSLFVTAYF